ncbi:hypothetical protein DPMN_046324 [Dreissena polymorpha]|uniref:Uncharacterized protein n=1 Tax=Dreissena polymorpha TaxID=45954 RepID=A0A9D4D7M4_DREPO|nr:hypothetical protein DPMN_046324 [Dreissena polymorpha]
MRIIGFYYASDSNVVLFHGSKNNLSLQSCSSINGIEVHMNSLEFDYAYTNETGKAYKLVEEPAVGEHAYTEHKVQRDQNKQYIESSPKDRFRRHRATVIGPQTQHTRISYRNRPEARRRSVWRG